ncbi:MAG: putative pyridoxal-dependent aspartate 1-decarboxylase [Leptolyngbya sp. SIOISBB]|nr:putative pyridoxal-dependent aspartate 1-decarboxylase [Leptolyngbya sp. SIOISBB]
MPQLPDTCTPSLVIDSIPNRIRQFFLPPREIATEQAIDQRILSLAQDFLNALEVASEIELRSLVQQFSDSQMPSEPMAIDDYLDELSDRVVAHSVHTASPRFIGHMTSALPYFVRPLARLMTALNQNVVKTETAKALTPYERQAIAMIHRLVYGGSDAFYQQHSQNPDSTLGMVLSGGTLANVAALWCARNAALPPQGEFTGAETEGLAAALNFYGYRDAVIIGSRYMHYSLDKAVGLLGLGTRSLLKLPTDAQNRIDLTALRRTIAECRAQNRCIIAIVGIAGTTDAGTIDPLAALAEIAQAEQIHLHVDAAWGGALLLSEQQRRKLTGIEQADSVTIDGHKQLYLPMGIGMVFFRRPHLAKVIEKQAQYIVRTGSIDLGKRSLEGSRAGTALFLHAALRLIGAKGYGWLIEDSIRKAQYLVDLLRRSPEFELLADPDMNLVIYRYLPVDMRSPALCRELTAADQVRINQMNEQLQKAQRQAGRTFVSRTTVYLSRYGDCPIVALRVVIANPLTTEADIDAVLQDQLTLAATLTFTHHSIGDRA